MKAIPYLTFKGREGGGGKEGKSVRQKMKKKCWEGEVVLRKSKKCNTTYHAVLLSPLYHIIPEILLFNAVVRKKEKKDLALHI